MAAGSPFDVNTWFDTYRAAYLPWMRMQEEAMQATRRLARLQNQAVGDYLESTCGYLHSVSQARGPEDFGRAQSALIEQMTQKWRERTEQYFQAAVEVQQHMGEQAGQFATQATQAMGTAQGAGAAQAAGSAYETQGPSGQQPGAAEGGRAGEASRAGERGGSARPETAQREGGRRPS